MENKNNTITLDRLYLWLLNKIDKLNNMKYNN